MYLLLAFQYTNLALFWRSKAKLSLKKESFTISDMKSIALLFAQDFCYMLAFFFVEKAIRGIFINVWVIE